MDRADPRRPPRLHQLGAVRDQPDSCWPRNAHAHGTRPRRRPRPRRPRPAAGPRGLRALRAAHDGPLPPPPRRRGARLPVHARTPSNDGAPRCQTIPGAAIDTAIGQLLLDTLTPLALEVALTVQAELDTRADEADPLRRHHVERARHRADLARRRYLAVDPDNRLVADTLEADWNDALRALASRPRRLRTRQRHRRRHSPRSTQDPDPRARRRLPRPVGRPGHPAAGTQTHGPPAHRRRHPAPRPTRSTCTSASAAARPDQPHHPDPARRPGKPARPTPTPSPLLDRLLDDHTDAETADAAQRRRPPLRRRASRSPPGSCWTYAAQPRPAQPRRTAPRRAACSPSARSPNASACTPPRSRPGTAPACSPRHKANDKNERLYEPPDPGDPRLVKRRQGSPHRQPSTHPTSPRRCSMKPTPCPGASGPGPGRCRTRRAGRSRASPPTAAG